MTITSTPIGLASSTIHHRIANSAGALESRSGDLSQFHAWFAERAARCRYQVHEQDLRQLTGWHVDPLTGNIAHDSGRFFTVEGLLVHAPGAAVSRWSQPIIVQPEVGILGILVAEFDGVLNALLQVKFEPGNTGGLQISPTVQATRSNYLQVHGGRAVPYVDCFRQAPPARVLADVRQSEQGTWFHQKRNRNIIVEVDPDVEVLDGFRWFTIGQLHQLLQIDHLINMDTRTVLACLPFTGPGLPAVPAADSFHRAARASLDPEQGSAHSTPEILSWLTDLRSQIEVSARQVPLTQVEHWQWDQGRIRHDTGRFFDVLGVHVQGAGREVSSWSQPLFRPHGTGLAALFVREIGGVLHALVQAKMEPGFVDVVELAPTVQLTPENYLGSPPDLLEQALGTPAQDVYFDAVLPEEGGRFDRAQTRYLIARAPTAVTAPQHRWMAVHQLTELMCHSHYLNVEARTLVACLHSIC